MSKAETWTTQDGRCLKIKDMTDSHIINTIHFLDRKAQAMKDRECLELLKFIDMLNGEMAIYTAEGELDKLTDMTIDEYLELRTPYSTLLWHAKRRKLDIRNGEDIRDKIKENRRNTRNLCHSINTYIKSRNITTEAV